MEKTAIEALKKRVGQFNTLELPGQPQGMHMGTSYLVGDLLRALLSLSAEVERMREALEQCSAEWMSPPCTVAEGAAYLYEEFARRAEVARAALGSTG